MGRLLASAQRLIGNTPFTDILLLPWLKPGGAEKYILEILRHIHALLPQCRLAVLSCDQASSHEWLDELPAGSVFLDVYNAFPMLEESDRERLVFQLLLGIAQQGSRLHIKDSASAKRLIKSFPELLGGPYDSVFYRLGDRRILTVDGWKSQPPRKSRLASENGYSHVLTDCQYIIDIDRNQHGFQTRNYRHIPCHTKLRPPLPLLGPTGKLLWASRLSSEKRPELIVPIMKALSASHPGVEMHVYGNTKLSHIDAWMDHPQVHYHGGFNGMDELPLHQFDALVYTSAFDGLPNIILESMAHGLPVIAPAICGIPEVITDGFTGLLVPDHAVDQELVAGYRNAIERLYGNWEQSREMAARARAGIGASHGLEPARKAVAEWLGVDADV